MGHETSAPAILVARLATDDANRPPVEFELDFRMRKQAGAFADFHGYSDLTLGGDAHGKFLTLTGKSNDTTNAERPASPDVSGSMRKRNGDFFCPGPRFSAPNR